MSCDFEFTSTPIACYFGDHLIGYVDEDVYSNLENWYTNLSSVKQIQFLCRMDEHDFKNCSDIVEPLNATPHDLWAWYYDSFEDENFCKWVG